MKVFFVMGRAHSGKSTFIKNFLNNQIYTYVDALAVETFYDISYTNAKTAYREIWKILRKLNRANMENNCIVVEFPGLTRAERELFLSAFDGNDNVELIACWCEVDEEERQKRLDIGKKFFKMTDYKEMPVENISEPIFDEGFHTIIHYNTRNFTQVTFDSYILTYAFNHCGYTGDNVQEAIEIIEQWEEAALPAEYYALGQNQ